MEMPALETEVRGGGGGKAGKCWWTRRLFKYSHRKDR